MDAEKGRRNPKLVGLPRGLRPRGVLTAPHPLEPADIPTLDDADLAAAGLRPKHELCLLGVFFAIAVLMSIHFMYHQFMPSLSDSPALPRGEPWRQGCQQCKHEWWDEFWRWRLKGASDVDSGQKAPQGMQWEWDSSKNDTDWFNASAELVDAVVSSYADPSLGPVLQIGCGESPLPAMLHKAGFHKSEHIDVVPQVIATMRDRYPASEWPGLHFETRDFLANSDVGGGPPPPLHRFAVVIDKAGIWDWLQDEAAGALPQLLAAVHDALMPGRQSVYVIATKQTPSELSETLARSVPGGGGFMVEATQPLGTSGIAWAYVLSRM